MTRDSLGRLSYVADRQLFAVVTADAGCGKSTLIRSFQRVCRRKNISSFTCRIQSSRQDGFIKDFRFLLNYKFDSESPMALVLVGQSELWEDKLRLKRYDAVRQRIDINCVLPHLDRAETEKYIQSHLNYAGVTDRELFSRRAVDEIFRMSCGIPRLINRICEKSLMYGCQQNLQVIDDQDVLYVSDHEMISGGDQL